jgi:hypothetical protein
MFNRAKFVIREAVSSYLLPAMIEQTASKVFESFSDRLKATLNGRQERALKLALEGHVTHKAERVFSVQSEDRTRSYLVDLARGFCTCPDSQKGYICKHRVAAYLVEQSMHATGQASSNFSIPASKDDEPIEKARLALHAKSDLLREAIIYATLQHDDQPVSVEVISLEGESAMVRALPVFKDGKLIPQFPFEGRQSCAQVLAKSLTSLTIYR